MPIQRHQLSLYWTSTTLKTDSHVQHPSSLQKALKPLEELRTLPVLEKRKNLNLPLHRTTKYVTTTYCALLNSSCHQDIHYPTTHLIQHQIYIENKKNWKDNLKNFHLLIWNEIGAEHSFYDIFKVHFYSFTIFFVEIFFFFFCFLIKTYISSLNLA